MAKPDYETEAKLVKLRAWQDFQHYVSKSEDEAEMLEYLELEKANMRRYYVMLRLYGRVNMLRTQRERAELIAMGKTARER